MHMSSYNCFSPLSYREMSLGSVNELGQFVSQFEQGTEAEKKKSEFTSMVQYV